MNRPFSDRSEPLQPLRAEGEHSRLAFRSDVSQQIGADISAFANTEGGTILIGVNSDGSISDSAFSDKDIENIRKLAESCSPSADIFAEIVSPNLIAIDIDESFSKPVSWKSEYCVRYGSESRSMNREEISRMLQIWNPASFERQICEKFRYPKDFNHAAYERWSEASKKYAGCDPIDALTDIEAARRFAGDIQFTNAAVLMFADNPARFFLHAKLDFIVFKTSSRTEIVKRHLTETCIPEAIDEILTLIEKYTNNAYEINVKKYGAKRKEHTEYHPAATAEILKNAVIHRNWSVTGTSVSVELFPDSLIVRNPGGLSMGVTEENMRTLKEARNPLLAEMFSLADSRNGGIDSVFKACEEIGSLPPEFRSEKHWMEAVLHSSPRSRLENLE